MKKLLLICIIATFSLIGLTFAYEPTATDDAIVRKIVQKLQAKPADKQVVIVKVLTKAQSKYAAKPRMQYIFQQIVAKMEGKKTIPSFGETTPVGVDVAGTTPEIKKYGNCYERRGDEIFDVRQNANLKITGADADSFVLLMQYDTYNKNCYAKDKNNVYENSMPLLSIFKANGTDPSMIDIKTVEILPYMGGKNYMKDANYVYMHQKLYATADATTFEMLGGEDDLVAKDKKNVYQSNESNDDLIAIPWLPDMQWENIHKIRQKGNETSYWLTDEKGVYYFDPIEHHLLFATKYSGDIKVIADGVLQVKDGTVVCIDTCSYQKNEEALIH